MKTLIFEVQLLGHGSVSRTIEIPEAFSLMIEQGQDIEPTGAGSVKKTMVSEVWQKPGDRMVMLFDYGDDWRFTVLLKARGVEDKKKKYPAVLEKTGRAPKQYA